MNLDELVLSTSLMQFLLSFLCLGLMRVKFVYGELVTIAFSSTYQSLKGYWLSSGEVLLSLCVADLDFVKIDFS